MTTTEKNRLIELITNPPAGSRLAAAKEYGIDLTLLVENLGRSMEERIQKASEGASWMKELRCAGKKYRPSP